MNNNIRKNIIILICIITLLLIVNLSIGFFCLDKLVNGEDSVSALFGILGMMVLPYFAIVILVQVVVLIFVIINKKRKKLLGIIAIVLEVMCFLVSNIALICVIAGNEIFSYLIWISFKCLNAYVIYLMISYICYEKIDGEVVKECI